ncbi:MAG: DUF4125 family protein [Lachnospiraceae bacterium]|nr:DUF4125 family protein [Lachnospiraceae bacterium]
MNIQDFRAGLDLLFEQNRIPEVEPYLEGALKVAIEESDDNAVVQILNEMVGFYRETCDYDRSIMYGEKALMIIENAGEKDSHAYATTELNLANALRAAGRIPESLEYYSDTERLYRQILTDEAFDFANLYNNMSLSYQEAEMFPEAIDCLNKAMETVLLYPDKRFELAVTHANLGNSLLGALRTDPTIKEAHPDIFDGIAEHLHRAVDIFIERNENGAHLGAALMGLGDLYALQGNDVKAADYYLQSMQAVDRNLGHVEFYYRAKEGYESACARLGSSGSVKGLNICRAYYEEIVKPFIEKEYPELKGKVTAGLFGEGSDAYGWDDTESRDHDWGPGVILLINNKSDYDRFGQKLQSDLVALAEKTPEFRGFKPDTDSMSKGRRGVFSTRDYYSGLIGTQLTDYQLRTAGILSGEATDAPYSAEEICNLYLSIPEYSLAAVVNGEVWDDPAGEVTSIRKKLTEYYPEELWRRMLVQNIALFSQNAQYNYLRQKRRADNVSASMLLAEGMKCAARIAYILEKKYAPHDKWLFHGLKALTAVHADEPGGYSASEVYRYIDSIFALDKLTPIKEPTDAAMRPIVEAIGNLSLYLQNGMVQRGLIRRSALYMEDVIMQINETKEDLVKRIVKDEWEAFDKVINEGGRADCQDNWGTFNIMRSSQYLTWDEDMLLQYAADFEANMAAGWNPIMEKYGRMEESTAPERYAEIKDKLPPVSDEKRAIIEEIVSVQVGWMEDFAAEYPKMAGNARTIHTSEDTPFDTSYETYLRGELMTYSDEMLKMYGGFIVRLAQSGQNLAHLTMENTALLYGYKSLEDAESSLL